MADAKHDQGDADRQPDRADPRQRETLRGLGLTRRGKTVVVRDDAPTPRA